MYNIEKLIACMKDKFTTQDEDDLVFKEKIKDIIKHEDLVENCKNPFYVEYEEINMYYTVGQYNISIVDESNNKLKTYEVLLQYTYNQSDYDSESFGDLPTTPTLIVKCGSLEEDVVGIYI